MSEKPDDQVIVWENLLSRDPQLIRITFFGLEDEAKQHVFRHLKIMAVTPGWHEQQVISAEFALNVLTSYINDDPETNR